MKKAIFLAPIILVPIIVGAALLVQTQTRGIDPDELEHLHAACAVSWGEVPYRDFFEHHPPALYYLLQPILRITGVELPALAWSRLLMWFIGMASLAATAGLAYRTSGKIAAMVAPALLCCTTVFFWKTIEVRPDVPAMFLLVLAAYGIVALEHRRGVSSLLIGLLLGLSILFTQKSLVPAAAMIIAQPTLLRNGRNIFWKTVLLQTFFIFLGVTAVWLLAIGLFSTAGAARAFAHATVIQLFDWPVRENPMIALRATLAADLPLWFAAAAAVVATIRRLCISITKQDVITTEQNVSQKENLPDCRDFLAVVVAISFIGGLLIQAAHAQYYLLWLPFVAVLAADSFVHWGSGVFSRRSSQVVLVMVFVVLSIESELATNAIYRGNDGALPHLMEQCPRLGFSAFAILTMVILPAVVAICCVRDRRGAAVFCLAAMAFSYAGLRNLNAVCWSKRDQVAAIAEVNRLVGPGETVFDGYTNLGVFRRHAYYYWWLNRCSLAVMSSDERGPKLLAALQKSPPKVICFDENITQLSKAVRAWIAENYRPIQPPLYLRNK